jgi:hypothetical protein
MNLGQFLPSPAFTGGEKRRRGTTSLGAAVGRSINTAGPDLGHRFAISVRTPLGRRNRSLDQQDFPLSRDSVPYGLLPACEVRAEGQSGAWAPVKALVEQGPSFDYRTVAGLPGMNKNTVQRIFQLRGWQVRKRAIGFRPRIQALPSVATAPDQRWSTDLCRVWGGRDGWLTLALVMDWHTRQLLGWHLSRSGKATTAASALEQALINRYGSLGRVPAPFLLRSDNGLVFTSRNYTRLVRSYGLRQEFITPHCPQQNGMVER